MGERRSKVSRRACVARAIHTRGSRLPRFAPSETTENDCFAVYHSVQRFIGSFDIHDDMARVHLTTPEMLAPGSRLADLVTLSN